MFIHAFFRCSSRTCRDRSVEVPYRIGGLWKLQTDRVRCENCGARYLLRVAVTQTAVMVIHQRLLVH
jgi:hypothetical protein